MHDRAAYRLASLQPTVQAQWRITRTYQDTSAYARDHRLSCGDTPHHNAAQTIGFLCKANKGSAARDHSNNNVHNAGSNAAQPDHQRLNVSRSPQQHLSCLPPRAPKSLAQGI